MKKRILVAVTLVIMSAAGAYAAGTGIPAFTDAAQSKAFTFKPSNNVTFYYNVDGSGGSTAQNYIVNTKNAAGNRIFSSSNNSSNIWYKESDTYKGKTIADVNSDIMTTVGESTYGNWSSQ